MNFMMTISPATGYNVQVRSSDQYPHFLGNEIETVDELLRSDQITKVEAQFLLSVLARRGAIQFKRHLQSLFSEYSPSRVLFMSYSLQNGA